MGIAPVIGGRDGDLQLPKALSLKAWTFHPSQVTVAGTQVNTHLASVYLQAGDVITNLAVPVTVAGATMTFAQLGIYDANLNLVASTPNSPAAFQATGWIEVALSTPYVVPTSGLYYLASGFTGTTLPTVLNIAQNGGIAIAVLPGGKQVAVHAQVPAGALPNPAVSQGVFTNVPLIVAR